MFFRYANYCGLEEPSDDINIVLDKMSERIGALQKGIIVATVGYIVLSDLPNAGGIYDHIRAAQHFLKKFRMGLFGQLTMDSNH